MTTSGCPSLLISFEPMFSFSSAEILVELKEKIKELIVCIWSIRWVVTRLVQRPSCAPVDRRSKCGNIGFVTSHGVPVSGNQYIHQINRGFLIASRNLLISFVKVSFSRFCGNWVYTVLLCVGCLGSERFEWGLLVMDWRWAGWMCFSVTLYKFE